MLGSRRQPSGSRKRRLHEQERTREADVLPSRPHCPGVPGHPGHGKAGTGSELGSSEYCREEKGGAKALRTRCPHTLRFVPCGRSRKEGGYGLGLAIAHTIVESHRGQIEVRSSKDTGTVFTVTFPHSRTDNKFSIF